MYKLPKNINLEFFLKKTLLQICIGAHDLIFNFDGDVRITITSSVGFSDSNTNVQKEDNFCKIASTVATLVNQTIVSVEGDESGTLKLNFDNGGRIIIYDDSEQFESYIIINGDQIIVV